MSKTIFVWGFRIIEDDAMKKCIYAVLTNPAAGREDAFNEWYTKQHLPDVLKAPGFKSAQRFTLLNQGTSQWKYLAIYEFEGADPNAILAGLNARAGTPDMVISQALDSYSATSWVAITERIVT
jgi:hypothetical protein